MNPEAQRLINILNSYIAAGVPRDHGTVKMIEGIIEQELAKGGTGPAPDPSGRNMDFMNPQLQPEGMTAPNYDMSPNVGPPPNFGPSTEEELEMIMPEEEFQGEGMGDF